MYQYDPLGYCIDNQAGYSVYTSMTGFTGNWTTNGNGGEPAPTVTEYSGASSSIVVSNAASDINWINTTYNMTSDTDDRKEFVSSDGTQLIIAVTTRQRDNGINGTPETGWEVRFVKSGYNTLISKYLYSNWQNVFTSDFELIHDGVSGGTIYSGIILQYSEEGSSSGGGTITVSGGQTIPGGSVNGTYTYESGETTTGGAIFRHTERPDFTCSVTYDGFACTLYIRSGNSRYMGSDSPGNTLEEMGATGTPFGSFYWVEEGSGMSSSIDGMSAIYTP
jgi:hypothetical protein